MDRAKKREFVAEMQDIFNGASCVVVTQYSGLSVAKMTELRVKMREVGASYRVTKNRLTKLAAAGTPYENICDLLQGPTGLAYSDDPVAPAKVVVDFAKSNDKLVVLGGAMSATALDPDGVKALASLPSLDQLRGQLVGLIQAPATKVAGVIQAPAAQLARVMNAYAEKDSAA